ncbi:arginase [Emcibacter sp.]|uniref:arginase n=1 Tax=Emcibacter sp. TaxID=1979954 RepID=UPI002AA60E60|nr:arginase [Emcibacter sp.]
MTKKISLIGVPSDISAGDRGATMGPEALRVAGMSSTLEKLGYDVVDTGNLYGPKNPDLPPDDGLRHLKETVIWCQNVQDAVYSELMEGHLPIMMGGDHGMSIGSVAAVSRYCNQRNIPLCVLWIDAHADFNTPDTSPSGNIHGMPVAVMSGIGPDELTGLSSVVPMVKPQNIYQVGIRSVDRAEKKLVTDSGINVFDMRRIDEIGMRMTMQSIIEQVRDKNAHLHVSFDVDSLDPTIAPGVGTTIPGGLTYREAQLCMEMVYDSGLMGSLDIAEINPALDQKNTTAELAVDLAASLFGNHILPPAKGKTK